MGNLELEKKRYWQESWFATIVLVLLTWSASFLLGGLGFRVMLIFIMSGVLYLFITRDTSQKEVLALRKLIKRSVIINGVIAVVMVGISFLPLVTD